jgi:hypothetical protein
VSGPFDGELEDLLHGDRDLVATAADVGAVLRAAEIDPRFLSQLRTRVVGERGRLIAERERRRRRWAAPRLPTLPWPRPVLAAAAVVAAAGLGLLALVGPGSARPRPAAVTAASAVAGQASVAPGDQVVVHFDRPMDHAAVAAALRVVPATIVRTAWRGDDMVVTPLHGLVPNAAYVLTIDRGRARTATGAALAADLRVVFGTARAAVPGGAAPPPVGLPVRPVAPADAGSEAVVASDGTLLATSAARYGFAGLLRLFPNGIVERLGPATAAICVSRSGRSLAYLSGSGARTSVVVSTPEGSTGQALPVAVDDGSPLGWIGDDQVVFVGGGLLRAIDRSGRVRQLGGERIDAARDTLVIAPGGRYVFLRHAAGAAPDPGRLVDLASGAAHVLPGAGGRPAFSADGGTVDWVDGSGPAPRLASAPSAGGPVLTLPLPVAAGERVADLRLGPDGSRLVYSVTPAAGGAELRLAAADDAATLAAHGGGGASPNWSPDGRHLAVLGQTGGQLQVEVADVPEGTADPRDSAEALAGAFGSAQVDGDRDAMLALAGAGVDVGRLPTASRATVVEVLTGAGGTAHAALRLVIDPTPAHPAPRVVDETLEMRTDPQLGRLVVAAAGATAPADVAPGPHVVRVAPGAKPGSVTVAFDSDLDPRSVDGAVGLAGPGGAGVPATAVHDPALRSVTVTAAAVTSGSLALTIGTGLRDASGRHLAAPFQAPAVVAGA